MVDLDLRSLAVCRVGLGLILVLDTLVRATDITAMYSDAGSLPRAALLELGWNPAWFSLYMGTGHPVGVAALMALQVALALSLALGWRTRVATFWSWLFLISIHSRNPTVLNGGDIYLRVVLFWMLFLPWGQAWSLDARAGRSDVRWWTARRSGRGLTVRSLAGWGLALQIAMVYWFAALPKTDPSWTSTFTATQLALRLDCFLTPFGLFFRETFEPWLALLTRAVIAWEFWGPFLLFFPFDRGQVRTGAIAGIAAMHTGFGLCMKLGFFAWIGVLMPLALLPSWVWEGPLRRASALGDRWAPAIPLGPVSAGVGGWVREAAYLGAIVYVLLWNMGNEKSWPGWRLSPEVQVLGQATRMDQRWNMFSPGPLTEDGWFVIEGVRRDGTRCDLLGDGERPVSWDKPEWIASTYKNERWRKYMSNLWMAENSRYRLPYGQYLSRKVNQAGRGPREVSEFKIYYMKEVTLPDGRELPPEKVEIWHHWCFDAPPQAQTRP